MWDASPEDDLIGQLSEIRAAVQPLLMTPISPAS